MARAEPRLDLSHLGQLLRRELALERVDRFHQILRVAPPLDRVVGKAPRALEGLGRLAVRRGTGGTCSSGTRYGGR